MTVARPAPTVATAPDAVPPVAVEHLTKRFGDIMAVDDLTLEVPPGSVLGLLGPNGAGKTTALRMVLGLVHPTRGRTFLFGRPMRPGSPLLRRVGSIVERPGFVPHMTGIDNLKSFWLSGGQPLSEAHLDEALEIAGLGPAIHRKVRTYSKGMQQRLALAQALLNSPELLVLDEPTVGLDPQEMREVRELIRRLGREGVTVLLSSHILAELEQVCTHAAVMNHGRLVAAGPVDELVGATRSVYMEVDDPGRALELLQAMPGITRVERQPPGISLQLNGTERKQIVAALVHGGIGVETVEARHRLEDAFIGIVEEDEV